MRAYVYKISFIILALAVVMLLGLPMLFLDGHKGGVIKLDQDVDITFEVDQNVQELLVYFGYVGCEDICVPALREIASLYKEIPDKESVQVYFINLIKDGDGSDPFSRFFHKDFKGLELRNIGPLRNQLRVYSSASLNGDGKISHTGFLYRINRQGDAFRVRSMYVTKPFNVTSIIEDLTKD